MMQGIRTTLKPLILETKDGEWGKGEAFEESVEMAVIRGTDFEDVRIGVTSDVPRRFIPVHIAARKTLRVNDIVIETAGGSKGKPTGRTFFIGPSTLGKFGVPATCASFSRFIRIDPRLANPGYVFWMLQNLHSSGHMLAYHIQHTGVARFQYTTFSTSEELLLPPRSIQDKIPDILFAYDDLVENNTRRIRILEEMAQTIYREWFTDFRFPGHQNVRMVNSSLGRVPHGWGIKKVSDFLEINPKCQFERGERKFVPMACLSTNSMLIDEALMEDRVAAGGSKFQNGDTLFARITPCLENGKTGFVQFIPSDSEVAIGSTEFIVLRSRNVCPEFVYLLARTDEFRNHAIKSMSGATGRQRVQEACFGQLQVAEPPQSVVSAFRQIVKPMFQMIYSLAKKNRLLRSTRDLLLPKLISGEVDISKLDIDVGVSTA